MHILIELGATAGCVGALLLLGAAFLHLLPRISPPIAAACTKAPGLDCVVTYFLAAPLIVGPIVAGWAGLFGAIVGQVASICIWTWLHELAHHDAVRGPRIDKVLNRLIGRWRNHAALWVTTIVAPLFWTIRIAQILLWPVLRWLTRFPRYNDAEWVAVSRQKFTGLVGHDLIWCLYCDWMTGVWSLGSEMLRNIESFWCPIRFLDAKKCANCSVDFPDLDSQWTASDGSVADVADLLAKKHGDGFHGWFGHPVRLTIAGRELQTPNQPTRSI